jgi:hypothetical protein
MNMQFPKRRRLRPSVTVLAGLLVALSGNSAAEAGTTTRANSPENARCQGLGCGVDPVAADRVEDVDIVVAVAMPADYPVGSVMRATCAFVERVEFPDGSARETEQCTLSDEPVMVPEYQGSPPAAAFRHSIGGCEWMSDYWYAKNETTVFASSARLVVTPAGTVHVTSTYPAEPLVCE